MTRDTIELTTRNRILEVTLANPPDNRLTPTMVEGLYEATSRFEADDVDMLLIQGSRRVFSKGFDVEAMKSYEAPSELRKVLVLSNAVFSRLARSPKPTIAAISGACMGGGLELAMADQKVLRHLVRLAACNEPPGAEDNIRDAAETFVELMTCLQKPST